jgi:hypothetical protein
VTPRCVFPQFGSLASLPVILIAILPFGAAGFLLSSSVRAQESAAPATAAPATSTTTEAAPASASDSASGNAEETDSPKKPGGRRRTREKEAEGTEARDRFKADTVIKSKYKLDGEPLEVDPD